ncbi:MAG: PSD1 domain-containing protein, partial [Planctomycetaceae bacterium]|nr:PSD1 domain-containing protein [Planctomycetaceae bacterium]
MDSATRFRRHPDRPCERRVSTPPSVFAALLLAAAGAGIATADEPVDFNRDVRPILSDKCFACHGPDAAHREADLRLDVGENAIAVSAIVPGNPAESSLVQRITSVDDAERMPPADSGKDLTPAEIDTLTRWIAEGAKYAPHWAYVKPQRVEPPRTQHATRNWIDAFVRARLEREGLSPAPPADLRTLARRLHFDLIGLPPQPDAVDAFVASTDPQVYDQLVDRLLASGHFGERLAMYWLDLVRYADTVGYHGDQEHHASPYRDYVIDAFNLNLPFDRFTREQLAGDLLPSPTTDQQIATCYNRLLQTSHEGGVQPNEYIAIYAADRVRNVSAAWMGATVGCAQCHDHKFDPYTAKDFYALAAFFGDIDDERHLRGDASNSLPTKRAPEIPVFTRREREQLAAVDARIAAVHEYLGEYRSAELTDLAAERAAIEATQRKVMVTQALESPRTQRLLPRGNWLDESGPVVAPAIPEFLGTLNVDGRATRLDLANWLVDAEHGAGGLTARVFVNRLWSLFFGAGLSRSLEDFGGQGQPPTHPELLDNLAVEFIDSGWDIKHVVRLIVTSNAYRQSSAAAPDLLARDPDNHLLARQGRWRVPAETIRDTALSVSGLLIEEVGGASARPYQPAGYYRYLNFPTREYAASTDASQWRRGVYVHWQR